jgi:hypothetical protein
MIASTYDFKPQIRGNTFDGIEFTMEKDGTPIDLTGVDIKMELRITENDPKPIRTLNIGDEIEVISPTAGTFRIKDNWVVNIQADVYLYDIKFFFSTTKIKTYIKGTFTVTKNITY